MPVYTYICSECEHAETQFMTVAKYIKFKEEKRQCSRCNDGVLFQQFLSVNKIIERRKDEMVELAKEEAMKIAEKVRAGDEKTIRDIYGDRPNPSKNE